ncbi:MAG: hypothetical protein KC996_10615 [Phycisphaerales bacterium]|nr:hypothetical protein [Phycisphaerales bacterium]
MKLATVLFLGMICGTAGAGTPTMGGPMSHLLVTLFDHQIYVTFESPSMSTVELQDYGELYDGAASVLNTGGYNSQFGWLANGFISLPGSSGIFVKAVHGSPWLDVYSESGFNPILGTDGSDAVWQWDGTMTHNWYSSRVKGTHSVRYEVFVGDLFGEPLTGYTPGTVELNFVYGEGPRGIRYPVDGLGHPLPSPGVLGGFGVLGGLAGLRRRR